MFDAPDHCPTCSANLELRELSCPACQTVIRGRWRRGPFEGLSADQVAFLTIFVRSRGNLSEVERALGVSYPTVRAKLEEIIATLDQPAPSLSAPAGERASILDAIARGEIDVDTGLARLRQQTPERNP